MIDGITSEMTTEKILLRDEGDRLRGPKCKKCDVWLIGFAPMGRAWCPSCSKRFEWYYRHRYADYYPTDMYSMSPYLRAVRWEYYEPPKPPEPVCTIKVEGPDIDGSWRVFQSYHPQEARG